MNSKSSTTCSQLRNAFRPPEMVSKLASWIQNGEPILIVGPTGSGKTSLGQEVARCLNRRVFTAIGGNLKTSTDLVGRYVFANNQTQFKPGVLARALDFEGPALFFIDDLHDARPEAIAILKSVLDWRRELWIDSKLVKARADFCCMASAVPPLRHLNPELRQRFRFLQMEYLYASDEEILLLEQTGVSPEDAKWLVALGECTRTRLSGAVSAAASTRLLLAAAGRLAAGETRAETVVQICWQLADKEEHPIILKTLTAAGLNGLDELRHLGPPQEESERELADKQFFESVTKTDGEAL